MNSSLQVHGQNNYGVADTKLLWSFRILLCRWFIQSGKSLFFFRKFVSDLGTFLLHFAHRSLTLTIFVEIADSFIGKFLGLFENPVSFLVGITDDFILT